MPSCKRYGPIISRGWRGALSKDLTAWDRPLLSATTVAAPNNYPCTQAARPYTDRDPKLLSTHKIVGMNMSGLIRKSGSINSSISWRISYGLDNRGIGVRFPAGEVIYLFSTAPKPAMKPIQPANHLGKAAQA